MGLKQLIFIILIIYVNSLWAEVPEMTWHKGYGTSFGSHVHEGMQTKDGGYIGIGQAYRSDDYPDLYIVKTDNSGDKEWQKLIGSTNQYDIGICIDQVSDGYIAGGAVYDSVSQRTQRFLVKLDLSGEIIWDKIYSSKGIGGIRGIDITDDGSIITTGYVNVPDVEEFRGYVFIVDKGDGFIMKLDSQGNEKWEKGIDAPQGTKVREINDGYAICSCVWTWTEEAGDNMDFCLFKTDKQGNTKWKKTYGGDNHEHCYDFDLTTDGGFILGGHTTSYGVSNWDYLLMKIDSSGNEEWHKTFGQPRGYDAEYIHDEAYGVSQVPDGGYIIAGGSGDEYGYSASGHSAGPSDEWKAYLVRTNGTGEMLWQGVYPEEGDVGNTAAEYIGLTDDGGYIVFTDTDCFWSEVGSNAYGFMKIESDPTNIDKNGHSAIEGFELYQNYPNPFNNSTTISYYLPRKDNIKISIYNLIGDEIKSLINQKQNSGYYSVKWNANNQPSGIYFFEIKTGSFKKSHSMILLK